MSFSAEVWGTIFKLRWNKQFDFIVHILIFNCVLISTMKLYKCPALPQRSFTSQTVTFEGVCLIIILSGFTFNWNGYDSWKRNWSRPAVKRRRENKWDGIRNNLSFEYGRKLKTRKRNLSYITKRKESDTCSPVFSFKSILDIFFPINTKSTFTLPLNCHINLYILSICAYLPISPLSSSLQPKNFFLSVPLVSVFL